jgi:uncharacterized protein (TIGR03435 family)
MRIAAFLTILASAWAQTPDAKLQFEVASIKPSPPPPGSGRMRVGMRGGPGTDDPTLFTCENYGLAALVILAYDIKDYQYAGPEWTQFTRFTVSAKIPPGTTKEQFRQMLQNLLAERFKLAVHHEKKDMVASYDLVVAKNGPKFKEAVEAPPPADDTRQQPGELKNDANGFPALPHGQGYTMAITKGRAALHSDKESMPTFAEKLSGQLRQPVTDSTGLKGKYDITMYWITDLRPSADEPGPSIFQALQEQLGLKLESKKSMVDILVVDHIEKTATEN